MTRARELAERYAANAMPLSSGFSRGWIIDAMELAFLAGWKARGEADGEAIEKLEKKLADQGPRIAARMSGFAALDEEEK